MFITGIFYNFAKTSTIRTETRSHINFYGLCATNFQWKIHVDGCGPNANCWKSDWHRGVRILLLRPYCNTVWQPNGHIVRKAAACKQTWYVPTKITARFVFQAPATFSRFEDLKVRPVNPLVNCLTDFSFVSTHMLFWLNVVIFQKSAATVPVFVCIRNQNVISWMLILRVNNNAKPGGGMWGEWSKLLHGQWGTGHIFGVFIALIWSGKVWDEWKNFSSATLIFLIMLYF